MRNATYDLEICQNNGTIAVRPSRSGKLKDLVRTTVKDDERVWVFGDVQAQFDRDGDEVVNHIRRGVMVGSFDKGREFLSMCEELGLVVHNGWFFVPFSNGFTRCGTDGRGSPIGDYTKEELKLMRLDLPSRDELAALVK